MPEYALRTVLRMVCALVASLVFSLAYAALAAKSRQAEKILIPILDILQSVPILGFLSITVTGFIALFPGRLLGVECAAIFAIFTSQAWNMTFSVYQSLRTVPGELIEAARMYHLSPWKRFWRLEVPHAIPSLVWNMMMSVSGGWFFVVASEAITVAGQTIMLPGIGSYIATAINQRDLAAIGYAVLVMFVVILLYDQLLFRPLLAWSRKFQGDPSADEDNVRPWFLVVLQRARLFDLVQAGVLELNRIIDDALTALARRRRPPAERQAAARIRAGLRYRPAGAGRGGGGWIIAFIRETVDLSEIGWVFRARPDHRRAGADPDRRGLADLGPDRGGDRAAPALGRSGSADRPVSRRFPGESVLPGGGGADPAVSAEPGDLAQPADDPRDAVVHPVQRHRRHHGPAARSCSVAAQNLGVRRWLWWRRVILPAIFPAYVTGAVTAAGGSWNASIVSEVVQWGDTTLTATGIGAYIARMTAEGDGARIALGIGVLCLYVLAFNRLLWRRLYDLAAERLRLD